LRPTRALKAVAAAVAAAAAAAAAAADPAKGGSGGGSGGGGGGGGGGGQARARFLADFYRLCQFDDVFASRNRTDFFLMKKRIFPLLFGRATAAPKSLRI